MRGSKYYRSQFEDLTIKNDLILFNDRALERFKCEPTEVNLNAYCIARAKARRDI